VVIRQENLHETRVVPLDGRPHLPTVFRFWIGDPRGSSEGDVLIVDSTNFTDLAIASTTICTSSSAFPESIATRRCTSSPSPIPPCTRGPGRSLLPMTRSTGQLLEDACHEGNRSLPTMLRAIKLQATRAR
jgi:hypothetical protein